jgi:long-subunit acyl-CoA synthetase (AMP-forming)
MSAQTMCEAFYESVSRCPDRVAVRAQDGFSMTWGEYGKRARDVAAGLHELGVRRGDTVAVMLKTHPEFFIVDTAAFLLGAVSFSIYNTAPPEDIAIVFETSQPRIAIVEDEFKDKVDAPRVIGISELAGIESRGAASDFDVEAAAGAVDAEDLLTLIYTSGTTGEPKGVELSHRNVVSLHRQIDEVVHWPDGAVLVHYLPMAHIGDRNTCHYWPMFYAGTTTCAPDITTVLDVMRDVRPHFVFGMPRLFEKLRAIVEREADGATREAIDHARLRKLGRDVPAPAETLLERVRVEQGFDRLLFGFTGGTMTSPDLLGFLHGLGVRVGEIWGLSEATGVATIPPLDALKIGTAGKPLPGTQVRLDEDGELLIKGPQVMRGYRNRPQLTAEAFTEDGWLRSGDIGEIDEDGYISVVDRKKELIIGTHGKNMAPARIEARLKDAFPLVAGAVAVGDERPYNVALLALDPDACVGFARERGLHADTPGVLAREPAVLEAVQRQVEAANEHLSSPERIRRFHIVEEAWLPGGDELTPTMKPKRRTILSKYAAEIDALYES